MFETFTEGAVKVIMYAQAECRRTGNRNLGSEQMLIGVLVHKHGLGALALRKCRCGLARVRKELTTYAMREPGYKDENIPFSPRVRHILALAFQESADLGQTFIGPEHLLLGVLGDKNGLAVQLLQRLGVDPERVRDLTYSFIEDTYEDIVRPMMMDEAFLRRRYEQYQYEKYGTMSPTPTIDEFADDLTQEALDMKLDPVLNRGKELAGLITALARRTKNNPVLIGEAGVGKTAVAEGLAQLIIGQVVPDFLLGSAIRAIDLGGVLAGTKYRGEFEERIKYIIEEAEEDEATVLVIDEIHTLVGAGAAEGSADAANILKPALARGKFRCIGATTNEEYKKSIERDPALERRFQPVDVPEPDVGTAIKILIGICGRFESHHGLSYTLQALEQSAILAAKYIPDRNLPDKAIDVMDEAASRVRLANRNLPKGIKRLLNLYQKALYGKEKAIRMNKFVLAKKFLKNEKKIRIHLNITKTNYILRKKAEIKREDIEKVTQLDVTGVIADWSGVPVTKLSGSESDRLLKMEDLLHERLIGQHQAVLAVSRAIRRARVGLQNPNRPIASFMFAGPTGVGKTELTKALAEYMFSKEDSIVRLDMSEYMEKHTVAKLIGSPPGYVGYSDGGQLTEAVRSQPYSLVLLDEVEKAHPDVFNLLLQLLDDGRLTDSQGRIIDFTQTLIVMTTNLGAKAIEEEANIKSKPQELTKKLKLGISCRGTGIGEDNFRDWEPEKDEPKDPELVAKLNSAVNTALKNFFKPEFINRIDEIIVFEHLTQHNIWNIANILVKQLVRRLSEKNIDLRVDPSVKTFLAEEGYDPIYGARPLRRAVMNLLEDRLAEECLSQSEQLADEDTESTIYVKRKTLDILKKEVEQRRKERKPKRRFGMRFRKRPKEDFSESENELDKITDLDLKNNFRDEWGDKKSDEEVFTNQIIVTVKHEKLLTSEPEKGLKPRNEDEEAFQ